MSNLGRSHPLHFAVRYQLASIVLLLATSANLSLPYGVAVDASGNIYIADTFNNRLRKVTGSTIGTVIGTMTLPKGVAVRSDGSTVAVSDTHNHRVRKVE